MDTPRVPRGHRALRKGRYSEAGRLYLLTAVTFQRYPIYADWRCAWAASAHLGNSATWLRTELLCWVLMPDHWHGLVRLGEGVDLGALMRSAKGGAARATNLARGRSGTIWEPGFWDRAIRREEDLIEAARYIIRNPVRAGLARRPAGYPYWDAFWLDEHQPRRTFDR